MKKKNQAYVRISPSNFKQDSILSDYEYLAEVVEYAINPY